MDLRLFNSMSLVELMMKLHPSMFEFSTNVLENGQLKASYLISFYWLSFLLLISFLICRVNRAVLGTKPMSFEGHSAVSLKDRIVILKKNPKPDDHTWFLEVSGSKPKSLI